MYSYMLRQSRNGTLHLLKRRNGTKEVVVTITEQLYVELSQIGIAHECYIILHYAPTECITLESHIKHAQC